MRSLIFVSPLLFFLLAGCKNPEKKETPTEEEVVIQTEEDQNEKGVILFFGDSLTAGYGLDQEEAFPALIQQKIDSLGLNYSVVNAGLSGETTASGKNRLDWVLNQNVKVFILELGANDGLRGIPIEETRGNLKEMIETVRKKNPEASIILAGMQIPPNMGKDYTSRFKNIFPELAEENNVELIPFLLKDVAGIPDLNQQDGIHPTAEGQKILAENVWEVLKSEITEKTDA